VGFDAEVKENAERMPKRLGHTIPFVMGLLKTLPGYKNKDIDLVIDGRRESRRVLSVIVSNGSYFGGGMKIAPGADLTDRQLDVLTIGDVGKLELLRVFPRVYKGTHITHPKVRAEKAGEVIIESSARILVQADGELLGAGPAVFRVLPAALNLAV
jgi:diacylglycerol kinase (ATP)